MKAERDPSFLQEEKERREDSPLIYRPEGRKDYYLPTKKVQKEKENKDNSKNDSMNVSNIISSLVEANKGRIVTGNRFGNIKR